jgi:hypothetical protein
MKAVWNKGIGAVKRRKISLRQLISQEPKHPLRSQFLVEVQGNELINEKNICLDVHRHHVLALG